MISAHVVHTWRKRREGGERERGRGGGKRGEKEREDEKQRKKDRERVKDRKTELKRTSIKWNGYTGVRERKSGMEHHTVNHVTTRIDRMAVWDGTHHYVIN